MFGQTKGGKLSNAMTHIIWANQKTESLLAMLDVARFPAFIGALDVILCILSSVDMLIVMIVFKTIFPG